MTLISFSRSKDRPYIQRINAEQNEQYAANILKRILLKENYCFLFVCHFGVIVPLCNKLLLV